MCGKQWLNSVAVFGPVNSRSPVGVLAFCVYPFILFPKKDLITDGPNRSSNAPRNGSILFV